MGAPVSSLQVRRDAPDWYHPGRSGVLALGKVVVAHFGDIHPAILEKMKIDGPAVGFEIFLDAIPQPRKKEGAALPQLHLSSLQPVNRDFAFVVDLSLEADALVRAVKAADKKAIQSASVFDVYSGKGMVEGKKSLAVSVTLLPEEKTFTDEELESLSRLIIDSVSNKTGGVLRG